MDVQGYFLGSPHSTTTRTLIIKVNNMQDQKLKQSEPKSSPKNSIELKWHQGTGIMENDCQQPLRIGRIRALNGSLLASASKSDIKSNELKMPISSIE